jgi:2-polyprenyl-3-methyl-5-hydroxy-6-metoxy-1,4-benzoquinol methylase
MKTWEQAVIYLREQERYADLVRSSYLDDPLLDAARRFHESEEWVAIRKIIASNMGSKGSYCRRDSGLKVLDIGAGRGIASYAFARDGWDVTALEPDPSEVVGAGAIRALARDSGLSIKVVDSVAETMPFESKTFDVVYGRQVFHHITGVTHACAELFRVLKPAGVLVVSREHVVSSLADLKVFLDSHVTHQLSGGENARLESDYVQAIREAGFIKVMSMGSHDSVINYYPTSHEDWRAECARPITRILGWRLSMVLLDDRAYLGRKLLAMMAKRASRRDHRPGRLFTFVARK